MPQIRNQVMETARKCDGQCQNCTLIQQTYCSAVRLHALMEHEQALFEKINHIEETLAHIGKPGILIEQGGGGSEKASETTTI